MVTGEGESLRERHYPHRLRQRQSPHVPGMPSRTVGRTFREFYIKEGKSNGTATRFRE